MRARLLDRDPDLRLFVPGEVVEHDDIAGPQCGDQHLFDIGEETRTIDGSIEDLVPDEVAAALKERLSR